jgi:hypothetical protein
MTAFAVDSSLEGDRFESEVCIESGGDGVLCAGMNVRMGKKER